jgi:hypothetical protein
VWDIYREDIEDWRSLRKKAREALRSKRKKVPVWLGGKAAELEETDAFNDIDPGLRAFMELEKFLKERRETRKLKAGTT